MEENSYALQIWNSCKTGKTLPILAAEIGANRRFLIPIVNSLLRKGCLTRKRAEHDDRAWLYCSNPDFRPHQIKAPELSLYDPRIFDNALNVYLCSPLVREVISHNTDEGNL